MNPSLFLEYIDKYFRLVVGKITEKFNGKATETVLLHKTMLTEEYSADLTWGATELDHAIVAADVVALDSPLPLKRRSTIGNASGKLPKMGVKYRKGEKAISDINVMIARGADESTVASKIFDDASKCIKAIDIRTEIMFLQALSTGICLVEDDDLNNGTAIRASFGYKDENTFHTTNGKWAQTTGALNTSAKPKEDVQQMFDKAQADGNSIGHVYISKKYFDLFRNSEEGKLMAASYQGQVIVNSSLLAVASRQTFLDTLSDEYGATFHIIDSAFRIEKKDGSRTSVVPWEQANVVGVPAEVVGRLVYGTLAEETNPVNGVNYQKSGSHILISKYSKTDPLEEFTAGQALAIPVIDGADAIYVLHADADAPLSVDPDELEFDSTASNKTCAVHYDGKGTLSATSSADFATATLSKGKVKVAVTANTGDSAVERTAVITISDGTNSVTIDVTQAAPAAA